MARQAFQNNQSGPDRVDPKALVAHLLAGSQRVSQTLRDFGSHPTAAIWRGMVDALSTPAKQHGPHIVRQVRQGHMLLADAVRRAHEWRVRHFLIHDWPSPGTIATYGSTGAQGHNL
ncbi:MAG: hypothetical protein AAF965_13805, partial [Pseudomonadota bacterium]